MPLKTTGNDALFRQMIRHEDEPTLEELQTLAMSMTPEELMRFCDGTMLALIVVQDQFKKRYPLLWAEWNKRIEDA